MTQSEFHARTVPLEYGPDALQFDGSPTVLFDRPGLTLVGWGTAVLVEAREAEKVLADIPCDDQVQRPGTGVLALGALPFLDTFAGHLIVPRFAMGIAQDPDGTTHRWATAVGPADLPLPETDELFDSVIWQYGTVTGPSDDVEITALTTPLSRSGYRQEVARLVAEMSHPGYEHPGYEHPGDEHRGDEQLQKVVLARSATAELSGDLPLSAVLRRLRAHEPACTIFSFPVPNGTFFCASPELLMARRGPRIWCHPLAGTIPRGQTARSDADAQGRLAASSKDRAEHRFVVDDIAAALRPFCDELTVPEQPSLVAFRAVAHLGTRIEGHLKGPAPATILELLERVHPTPAVGGTPRRAALAAIAESEPVPRDYWAGPVGWLDAQGDGEWMIGIRSARLHTDGQTITLHAGAGVVADSDPESEATETDVKFSSVLESLVPGGSTHLR
jgi:menaquinone-specific isochorismate synthase